nr:MAG TPA: hypothetical protein [Caudoviricetes sp.]
MVPRSHTSAMRKSSCAMRAITFTRSNLIIKILLSRCRLLFGLGSKCSETFVSVCIIAELKVTVKRIAEIFIAVQAESWYTI